MVDAVGLWADCHGPVVGWRPALKDYGDAENGALDGDEGYCREGYAAPEEGRIGEHAPDEH